MAPPTGERFSARDLSSTGDVIDAIGRLRTPTNFAAVSRALLRLSERGDVKTYTAQGYMQGKGFRYCLASKVEDAIVVDSTAGPRARP